MIVLEVDGSHHFKVESWEADIKRERAIVLTRRTVLRATANEARNEQVGTWRSLEGRTMRLTAATAAPRKDIAAVEVRTTAGRTVLESSG